MRDKRKNISEEQQYVENRLRSAARTLWQLPDNKIQGYFNAWPEVIREELEILQMEPSPLRLRPKQSAITEMEEVLFSWLYWLNVEERKLVWQRAEKVPWKIICYEIGCDRTTAWRKYKIALAKIAARLENIAIQTDV